MHDIIQDVPTFAEVVEAGSFAAAGVRLGVTRSAVAKSVARLERRLGVRLFQRTTRSLSLTEEGQVFHGRCRRAIEELDAGAALLEAGRTAVTGTLRVSMPVLFGRLRVAPALLAMARAHADLRLDLEFNDHYVDVIGRGYDLCVRTGPALASDGLRTRRVATEATVLCAAPDYLARNGEPTDLAALSRYDTVAYARGGRTQVWRFPGSRGRTTDILPSTRFHLDDLGSILDFAVAGLGIAWLPDWLIANDLRAGRVVRLLPKLPPLTSPFYAVWPETPHLARRVRVAIDTLADLDASDRAGSSAGAV